MDLREGLSEGDKVIDTATGKTHTVKYFFSNFIIVDSGNGYDMPLTKEQYVTYSPLMEALLCQT
jgi:hypothetical protein